MEEKGSNSREIMSKEAVLLMTERDEDNYDDFDVDWQYNKKTIGRAT